MAANVCRQRREYVPVHQGCSAEHAALGRWRDRQHRLNFGYKPGPGSRALQQRQSGRRDVYPVRRTGTGDVQYSRQCRRTGARKPTRPRGTVAGRRPAISPGGTLILPGAAGGCRKRVRFPGIGRCRKHNRRGIACRQRRHLGANLLTAHSFCVRSRVLRPGC